MIIINFVASDPYVLCPCCAGTGEQVLETNRYTSQKIAITDFRACTNHPTKDNQWNGEETQAKALMLLMLHPWYGLIRFSLKPCNFILNIFYHLVFAYSKQER